MPLWTKGGKLIVDSDGKLIICDHCPCGGGESSLSSASSGSIDTSCPHLIAGLQRVRQPGDNCEWYWDSSVILQVAVLTPPYPEYMDVPEDGCAYALHRTENGSTRIVNEFVIRPDGGTGWYISEQHPSGSDNEVHFEADMPSCTEMSPGETRVLIAIG